MSVTEFQRHQVFQWLEEAMGPERAAIMMDLLPPVGWGDIATKADLGALRVELRGDIAQLRGEAARTEGSIAHLEGKVEHAFARLQRQIYVTTIAGHAALVGLLLTFT